jgi:endonuclease/exonuclease/phosphatase family metal-dependent hydrolase
MDRLKVLTLNTWNRQGPWPARRRLIREGIAALAPDIVGLQEILDGGGQPNQADEIADGLGYHVHHAPAGDFEPGVPGLTMGNAVLARYPIVAGDGFPLPSHPGDIGRVLTYALVDAPCGQVPVFTTHLSWMFHQSRARCDQVLAIAATIKRVAPIAGFPPVLMGDFNAEPDSDEMRYLRGLTPIAGQSVYFSDCWLHTTGQDPAAGSGFTYDRRNTYALRSREPSRRIDYVYVRGPDRQLRGEPLSARVVLDQPRGEVWASDHYGVLAEIQAAPRPLDPY